MIKQEHCVKKIGNKPRKRLFINSDFQVRYALLCGLYGVFTSGITCFALVWSFKNAFHWQGTSLPFSVMLTIAAAIGISAIIGFFLGLKMSAQVAGPIHNISNTLSRVVSGERDVTLQLRDGDNFQDIANSFNILLHKFHEREEKTASGVEKALKALQEKDLKKVLESIRSLPVVEEELPARHEDSHEDIYEVDESLFAKYENNNFDDDFEDNLENDRKAS